MNVTEGLQIDSGHFCKKPVYEFNKLKRPSYPLTLNSLIFQKMSAK